MRRKPDLPAAALCAAVGLLMAALPHLLAWAETGDPTWVADHDERFYLMVGSQAYFNHPGSLTDPMRAGDGPSIYKPLPLLPGVWMAKLLGLGPLGIALSWRVLAGLTIGLAWYLLLRQWVGRPWAAAALALILLADGGIIDGRPLLGQAENVARVASGRTGTMFGSKPNLHPEWRISTPGVTMAYLALCLWALARARETPTRGRIAAAGVAFGLLFYVYFYYWTAFGLALLLALALDSGHRKVYFHAGWIGGLVGLPSIVSDALMKRGMPPDWLPRTDKFLPIGRLDELLIPKQVAALLVAGLVYVLVRRRELIHVWALAASGLLLANHQVVSGLQIENFHWCYVWGPATSLLVVLAIAREVEARTGWASWAAGAVALLVLASGLWLRTLEATRCVNPVENRAAITSYQSQRPPGRAQPLRPNAVVAGDLTFVDFATILDNLRPLSNYCTVLSPTVTDPEWDDRIALNAILLGQGRLAFEAEQLALLKKGSWGPWARAEGPRAARLSGRLDSYDRATADLPATLAKYGVAYVALPTGSRPGYLASGWTRIEAGPTWDVWEYHPASRPSPAPGADRRGNHRHRLTLRHERRPSTRTATMPRRPRRPRPSVSRSYLPGEKSAKPPPPRAIKWTSGAMRFQGS